MRVPEGATVIRRDDFFDEYMRHKDTVKRNLEKTGNTQNFYGGLVKRGFSASDVDIGLKNFIEPQKENIRTVARRSIKNVCPECKIEPSLNPKAFGDSVIHAEFTDLYEYSDKLDTYWKSFDETVDMTKRVILNHRIGREVRDEVESIIRDVTSSCSELDDIDEALNCTRTQLHERRTDIGYKIRNIMYKLKGRAVPIKWRPD